MYRGGYSRNSALTPCIYQLASCVKGLTVLATQRDGRPRRKSKSFTGKSARYNSCKRFMGEIFFFFASLSSSKVQSESVKLIKAMPHAQEFYIGLICPIHIF